MSKLGPVSHRELVRVSKLLDSRDHIAEASIYVAEGCVVDYVDQLCEIMGSVSPDLYFSHAKAYSFHKPRSYS